MKKILKYLANAGWDITENIISFIIKGIGTFLLPEWTTKLHKYLADLDALVQKKIDNI